MDYNIGLQHWTTTLDYNIGLQHWTTTLAYNTIKPESQKFKAYYCTSDAYTKFVVHNFEVIEQERRLCG